MGEQLKQFRLRHNLSKGQMARLVGVTRKTYPSYEDGMVPRSAKTRSRIAEVLELDEEGLREELGSLERNSKLREAMVGLTLGANPITATAYFLGTVLDELLVDSTAKGLSNLQDGERSGGSDELEKRLSREYDERRDVLGIVATFLIRARLDELGIAHSVVAKPDEEVGLTPDHVVLMPGSEIESWWLCFWPEQHQVDEMIGLAKETRAHLMFARFLECVPDESRKMSMVIDDAELFDELVKFSGRNSYRGNLSVVLVDPVERKLVSESYLATYGDPSATVTPFRVVGR